MRCPVAISGRERGGPEYLGRVPQTKSAAATTATRYLRALARLDWDEVTACLAADVLRRGPYGDDYEGTTVYIPFLQRTMPALPGYRMDIDRVSDLGERRAMVELRETIELEDGPLVTHECLVFDVASDGLIEEICIYIRQAPKP
jgi:ketosteroid isomerase-like protein